MLLYLGFYLGAGDPKSGLHLMANILSIKPPCPGPVFLKVVTLAVDTTATTTCHQDLAQEDRYGDGDGDG